MTLALSSPQLNQLANSRCEELSAKWSGIAATDKGISLTSYLCACSDFIYQSCLRFEPVANYFLTLTSAEDLLLEVPCNIDQNYDLDEVNFTKLLREYRQWIMSVIAARDFLKLQPIAETMKQLSHLGDCFYVWSRSWAKKQLLPRWGRAIGEDGSEVELIALGMGKLGGGELNFSSDIDLIFAYAEKGQTSEGRRQEDFQIYFTKLAQKIIQLLDSVTPEGRVFRVDMRLRPFGDSGPLVSSFDALEDYYQDQGRDWERYALLKARPLGLDMRSEAEQKQQQNLMVMLKPFVYRRYIDFSVIDSLRKMKLMIQQEVKRRNLSLNIKLGEGGIREAEFIVQALQMLRGGKAPELQSQSLLAILPVLTKLNVFNQQESDSLLQSYLWLRQCEQCLQAFADEQTQTLPADELNQQRLLQLFEIDSWQEFLACYQGVCQQIHQLFSDVIGEAPSCNESSNDDVGNWEELWQLGGELELEDALKEGKLELDDTLKSEQQTQPENSLQASLIDLLKHKKVELTKAVSGARGQEKLDALMPFILYELEQQKVAKEQAESVLTLIKTIASRTTYLELLLENPGARNQLVKLVTSCNFIGQQLTRFPLLLDLLIDPKLLYSPVAVDSYHSELRRQLLRVEPQDLELQMEVLRQFKLSSQLAIAACDVENVIDLMKVSDHLTSLAEACLQHAVNLAWSQMVERYGYPVGADDQNKNFGVIGYGKLGGYELGYGSDLDIVFIHNCQSSQATSGKKQIDSRQFYIKLAQRIMHIFTTRTFSGELYEIDTRLRPSGASGLLAINIETFADYQHKEAWTWEHQALVRSRFVLGDDSLQQRFAEIRKEILSKPRESSELAKDISQMRKKMYDNLSKEKAEQFDLKQSRGGIADIEFISQFIVLEHAQNHPELMIYPDNVRILEQAMQAELLSEKEVRDLVTAYLDYRAEYHHASLNGLSKLVDVNKVKEQAEQVRTTWQKLNLA